MAGPGGTEVGRVSVKVVPDVDGFREKVKKELEQVEKMQADVELTLDLTKFKAQIEEAKLLLKSIGDETVNINVNKNGGIAAVSAETKKAATEAKKLAQNLKDALGDGEQHKVSRFTQLMQSFGETITKTGQSVLDLSGKVAGQLAEGLKSVGGSLFSMIIQITVWVPLILGIIGLVTFLVGFLAAALLTLPALLFGILGPLAAIAAGFDGIKKAAKTLKPELDALKKRLSDTFAKELKPLFESIKGIFPVISDGLNNIAIGVSRFVTELAKVFTSADGVEALAAAFKNVNVFLDSMLPGLQSFLRILLQVATVPEIFQELGGAISDVFVQFQRFFNASLSDGTLVKSVQNFRIILADLLRLFSDLLTNSLKFFNGATPGMDKFFRSLSDFFSKIDWERLGKAFGDIFGALGDAISQIPPETIELITEAFVNLAKALGDLLSGDSLNVIITLFVSLVVIVTEVINFIDLLSEGFANFAEWLDTLPEKGEAFFAWLRELPNKILEAIGNLGVTLFAKGRELLQGLWDGAVEKAEEVWAWLRGLPQRAFEALQEAAIALLARGREFIQGLWDGMVEKGLELWAWIRGIPQRIIDSIPSPSSILSGIGGKIIDGLISGMKGALPSLGGFLGTITSFIVSHKGPPAKDAKMLIGNGKLIMQGLQQGLSEGFRPVAALLDGMSSAIQGTFNDPQLLNSMKLSGADITAVGSSQLTLAGQVESNSLEGQIVSALSGWTIDGKGVARTVNNANTAQRRRG